MRYTEVARKLSVLGLEGGEKFRGSKIVLIGVAYNERVRRVFLFLMQKEKMSSSFSSSSPSTRFFSAIRL